MVTRWDDMELIWAHTFDNELRIDDGRKVHAGVLLTEPPLNPRQDRERMVQIMFEKFNVPGIVIPLAMTVGDVHH
eukprot:gene57289-biopygen115227